MRGAVCSSDTSSGVLWRAAAAIQSASGSMLSATITPGSRRAK